MKRPSFQFYPADWRANAKLRRCSPAARGVWMDILCLLHDADDYGMVRWPLKEIAQAVGASISHVRELVEKDVLKGADKGSVPSFIYTPRSGRRDGEPVTLVPTQDGPVWYSTRMMRDEYVRTVRGQSSRFGADNGAREDAAPMPALNPSPKPPFGHGSSSSSSSSFTSPIGEGADAPEKQAFAIGREVLGRSAGGLVTKLRKHHGDDWSAVLRTLHLAGGKDNPTEYVGAILRGERAATADAVLAETDALYRSMGVQ